MNYQQGLHPDIGKVEQAGPVIAGQWLVKLDTEKIDQEIERARMDLEIARAKLERQTEEAKHQEEASAIQLANAEMAYRSAEQTLTTFKDVLMPMKIAEAELNIQSAKDRLKESEEQFEQLMKMYGSDDLVEETEEIVLNREKRSLEQSRKRLTFSLRRHELLTTVDIPRELQGYELAFRKATNAWEVAKVTSRMDLEKSANELAKARWELARQEDSFEALQRDREALTIRAPAAGVAVATIWANGPTLSMNPGKFVLIRLTPCVSSLLRVTLPVCKPLAWPVVSISKASTSDSFEASVPAPA